MTLTRPRDRSYHPPCRATWKNTHVLKRQKTRRRMLRPQPLQEFLRESHILQDEPFQWVLGYRHGLASCLVTGPEMIRQKNIGSWCAQARQRRFGSGLVTYQRYTGSLAIFKYWLTLGGAVCFPARKVFKDVKISQYVEN